MVERDGVEVRPYQPVGRGRVPSPTMTLAGPYFRGEIGRINSQIIIRINAVFLECPLSSWTIDKHLHIDF